MHAIHRRNANQIANLMKDMREQVTCAVCLDIYKNPVRLLQCKHVYCKECYNDLLKYSSCPNSVKCPMCKMEVKRREFKYEDCLQSFADYVRRLPDYIIEDKSDSSSYESQKPKQTKTIENLMYTPLHIKKETRLRKTRSLDCVNRNKTQNKQNTKRYSLGNISSDEEIIIDEYITQKTQNKFKNINDRHVINMLEEDCLANLENEFFGPSTSKTNDTKIKNKGSAKKNKANTTSSTEVKTKNTRNKANTSAISLEPGWARMKNVRNKIEPKTKPLKQLNISMFSNKKMHNTRSAEKQKNNRKISPPKTKKDLTAKKTPSPVKRTRGSYKLDQFEAYLEQNLPQIVNNSNVETKESTDSPRRSSRRLIVNKEANKIKENKTKVNDSSSDTVSENELKPTNPRGRKRKSINKELNKSDAKADEEILKNIREKYKLKDNPEEINPQTNFHVENKIASKVETRTSTEYDDDAIFEMATQKLSTKIALKPEYVEIISNSQKSDTPRLRSEIIKIKNNIDSNAPNKNVKIHDINNEISIASPENIHSKLNTYNASNESSVNNFDCLKFDNKLEINQQSSNDPFIEDMDIENMVLDNIPPNNLHKESNVQNTEERFFNKFLNLMETNEDVDVAENVGFEKVIVGTDNIENNSNNSKQEEKRESNLNLIKVKSINSQDESKSLRRNNETMKDYSNKNEINCELNVKEKDSRIEETNQIKEKCLEYLKLIQNDVVLNNDIVKEISTLLSNTKYLFSGITNKKIEIQNFNKQTNHSEISLSNSSKLETIDFYNTSIPYLTNLQKLYSDFKFIVSDMTAVTKKISEIFGQNSDKITALLSEKKSDTLPSTITANSNIFTDSKIYPLHDMEIQTDELKCSKCSHVVQLELNQNAIENMELDMSLNGDKSLHEKQVSIIKETNQSFAVTNMSNNLNTNEKKVNRKLRFSQNEQKYKRIRKTSSDSDSDAGIKQKTKMQRKDNDNDDLEVAYLFDSSDNNSQENKKETRQNQNIKNKTQKQSENKKSVVKSDGTQDVTAKFISLLEREYKELHTEKSNSSTSIIKQNVNINNEQYNKPSFNYERETSFSIEKMFENSMTDSFAGNKSHTNKEILSKSLFTESDNILNRPINDSFNSLKSTFISPENIQKIDKFSASLFTEDDKTICPREKTNLSQQSGEDLFMNEEVEDSLEGNDIFKNVDIIESTPQKDRSNPKKTNLDDFVDCLNEEAKDITSEMNLENTEWAHFIAPPPEFQDNTEQINLSNKDKSIDIISLSICNESLNKNININYKNDETYFDENIKIIDNTKTNENCFNKLLNSSLVEDNVHKNVLNTSARNNSFRKKTKPDQMNTSGLFQKENITPLQIIKTTNYVPKSIIPSTPKQTSMFNFLTPNKNNTISSNKSISLSRVNTRNQSFGSNMEITPIKEKTIENSSTRKTPICIACSRLNKEENLTIVSLTDKFNLIYSKQFSNQVTHLIVLVDERNRIRDHTMKYIAAIANGIWIVSLKWAQECLKQNRILPEEPYEVLDVSSKAGPKRSRLTRKTNPLLKNFTFHFAEPFVSITKQDLENVVTGLGGEAVQNLSSLTKVKGKVRLILTEAQVSQDFDQYQIWLHNLNIITVDIEWLSRIVGQYEVSSIRPFMLCLDDGIENLGYPSSLITPVPDTLTESGDTTHY